MTGYQSKKAMARDDQKPVAWMDADGNFSDNNDHNCFPIPLYTIPPQQETVFFGVKDQGVKVSSLEFVTRVMGKEEVIGKPIFWAEWPSKENT